MKKIVLLIVTFLFCVSCGVKDDPEYKSQANFIKKIYLI